MKSTIYALTFAACCLSTGCSTITTTTEVPAQQLNTLSDAKSAYLEKVKHLDCVTAGVLDSKCYEMKKAAKEGFEDAFVDAGNGVYVLDPMKLEYLKALEGRNATPSVPPRPVKAAQQ